VTSKYVVALPPKVVGTSLEVVADVVIVEVSRSIAVVLGVVVVSSKTVVGDNVVSFEVDVGISAAVVLSAGPIIM